MSGDGVKRGLVRFALFALCFRSCTVLRSTGTSRSNASGENHRKIYKK